VLQTVCGIDIAGAGGYLKAAGKKSSRPCERAVSMKSHDDFYQEVGRRIRAVRKQRNLTQEDLGGRVSLTRTSITNIEKGRQKLLLHTLAEIADALEVGASKLIPESEGQPDQELEEALKDRPTPERQWIKSAVSAVRKEKSDGSS
jgi:transcriptional regulator with XRE-family HTH domain